MLDPKFIRDNEEVVRNALVNRNYDLSVLEKFLHLDKRWRPHCHIADHEDNDMMRPDLVSPNNAVTRTYFKGFDY